MVTRARKIAVGYYLIAIAVVFGFMAFTLIPAQANAPVEKEPPLIEAPTYDAKDPDLIKGASNQVKIGDKVKLTFIDLPEDQLELIRFGEPVRKDEYGRYPQPKHEVFTKTFTEEQPSAGKESFEYPVPCWSLTSKDAEDQLSIQGILFFKDGSTATAYANITVLDSKSLCPKAEKEPTPDPNFDPTQLDGKKADATQDPSPSPSASETAEPTVSVSPKTAQQTGQFLFTIQGLPTANDTKIAITLASKDQATMGNPVLTIVENKHTNGNPVLPFNWNVPCKVKPGKYAVTVDVLSNAGSVPSADSEVFTITQGNCSSTTPPQDPTPDPSAKPTVKPTATPEPSAKPTVKPTATPEPSAKPTVKPTPTPEPSAKPTVKPTPTPDPSAKPTVKPTATPEPSEKPTVEPETPNFTFKIYDAAGKELSSLPRNQKLTIKTTYDGDAKSVDFELHSNPVDLGNTTLKNGAAQLDFSIKCSFPTGKHKIVARYSGNEPLIVEKHVLVTAGDCLSDTEKTETTGTNGTQTPLTPFVSAGTSTATGPGLAQTGTASMLLAMLSIMFATSGLYLIISRREHV